MKTQKENHKVFTIKIHHDPDAENPFESRDCEPPLLALRARDREATCYNGAPVNVGDVADLLPPGVFKRGNRVALIRKNLGCSLREFAEARRNIRHGNLGDAETAAAFVELAEAEMGCEPRGWEEAIAWMEWAEDLLNSNGTPALSGRRDGYSRGDSVLLLAVATREWLDKAGVEPSHAMPQLKGALDLYAAWAFGDVYGYVIKDEEGNDTGESCWGYYGSDIEQSGLMDDVRDAIDRIVRSREEAALNEPACLI